MPKESQVEIAGHLYRYVYDPATKATRYLGPVGSAPALSEQEFFTSMKLGIKIEEDTGFSVEEWDELLKLRRKTRQDFSAEYTPIKEQMEKDLDMERTVLLAKHSEPLFKKLFEKLSNDENWKLPPKEVIIRLDDIPDSLYEYGGWTDIKYAVEHTYNHYLGGSEVEPYFEGGERVGFKVTSKGYYHYIGA